MHGDSPIWFDHGLVHLWKYDLAIRTNEVVMTFVHVLANDIDMQEGLLDKRLHSLCNVSLRS